MRLEEALLMACRGKVVRIVQSLNGNKKEIRCDGVVFHSFEQREFLCGKWSDWVNLRLSEEQINSDEWYVFEEEKEMSFSEALAKLLELNDGSIIYQRSNDEWQYKLYAEHFSFFSNDPVLLQRRRANEWEEDKTIQFTKDMMSKNDWVVEPKPEKTKEQSKEDDEDCGHDFCRMMKSSIFGSAS